MDQVDPGREKILQEYRKKLQEHADIEVKLKKCKLLFVSSTMMNFNFSHADESPD